MRGRSLHVHSLVAIGLAASAIAVLLVLGFGSSADAANPHPGCNNFLSAKVLSCHFSSSFADDDFCGTGQTVEVRSTVGSPSRSTPIRVSSTTTPSRAES